MSAIPKDTLVDSVTYLLVVCTSARSISGETSCVSCIYPLPQGEKYHGKLCECSYWTRRSFLQVPNALFTDYITVLLMERRKELF